MVVVLAIRISCRLDKGVGELEPFGWAQRCVKGREEVARSSDCVVAEPPNFESRLGGRWKQGKERGKGPYETTKQSVRNGSFDDQVKIQYTPTNPPSSPHVPSPFGKERKNECPLTLISD